MPWPWALLAQHLHITPTPSPGALNPSSSILEHGLAFQGTNNEGIPLPSVAFCPCSFVKKERINRSFLGWGIELL